MLCTLTIVKNMINRYDKEIISIIRIMTTVTRILIVIKMISVPIVN